jgi:hypothetical protein
LQVFIDKKGLLIHFLALIGENIFHIWDVVRGKKSILSLTAVKWGV